MCLYGQPWNQFLFIPVQAYAGDRLSAKVSWNAESSALLLLGTDCSALFSKTGGAAGNAAGSRNIFAGLWPVTAGHRRTEPGGSSLAERNDEKKNCLTEMVRQL